MDEIQASPLVLAAVEELNGQLPPEQQVSPTPEAVLFGRGGRLDSLGLVNLLLLVEERVADQTQVRVTLADERAMSQKNSPFRTVRALAEYVTLMVKDKQDG